ncbi:AMP-dependent synthetase [Prauserella marina]|uniref:O-succinylbenzoic acid--CoA ligase n=1 Tax=Prauserella marina TaxID=530584 RepID=A0A222VJD9_9PSEU|nr:o-succinylbenzoate--CoA ligase [Prauserella marina]ASR33984.1 AMP-dependent synthetase [Prauserella marina]PWV82597.1 O-succinylbenzoic acid--CoA ligase [Prauserella marina]SDC72765.1 O-succinylbenzoic acid--CoA ligase [Prauserella marina]
MRVVWTDGSPERVAELRDAVLTALDGGPAVLPLDQRNPAAGDVLAAMAAEQPVEPGTAVIMPTSGSTGGPKGVLLSASALLASAMATHDRLGGEGRWLLATPANYIGGLQVLVRAHQAGTAPTVLDMSAGFDPGAFAVAARSLLAETGPHYTALVPTQLGRLLDAGNSELAGFSAVVLGGAALDDRLRSRAEQAGVRVVPAYGMSETASGCVYDGRPLDGVRVRLGEGDRIEIAGPVLTHGYRLRPDLTAAAFSSGWFLTSDLGALDADGRLSVLGRVDDVINTGGVKVPAGAVERVLSRQPGVRSVCVVGLPDAEWGQLVAAAVVPDGEAPPVADLLAAVRAELGAAHVPKRVRFVARLPLIGPGKIDRSGVRTTLLG